MKQRASECVLASVCIATGQDYPTASDLFRELYGTTWGRAARIGCTHMRLDFLAWLAPGLDLRAALGPTRQPSVGGPPHPALDGRGVVLIHDAFYTARHAMAYADGLVEDPYTDTILPLAALLGQYYAGWRLESVHPLL